MFTNFPGLLIANSEGLINRRRATLSHCLCLFARDCKQRGAHVIQVLQRLIQVDAIKHFGRDVLDALTRTVAATNASLDLGVCGV